MIWGYHYFRKRTNGSLFSEGILPPTRYVGSWNGGNPKTYGIRSIFRWIYVHFFREDRIPVPTSRWNGPNKRVGIPGHSVCIGNKHRYHIPTVPYLIQVTYPCTTKSRYTTSKLFGTWILWMICYFSSPPQLSQKTIAMSRKKSSARHAVPKAVSHVVLFVGAVLPIARMVANLIFIVIFCSYTSNWKV